MKYIEKECKKHGNTKFILENRGYYRCCKCRSENVAKRRTKVKTIIVNEHGGKCIICGYSKYIGAIDFHHVDPMKKSFGISEKGMTYSLERMRQEASKCVILCRNCHAEVEAGIAFIPEWATLAKPSAC